MITSERTGMHSYVPTHSGIMAMLALVMTLTLAAAPMAAGEAQRGAVADSGVRSGLCVVLPAVDGEALAGLVQGGAFVVQGLVPDEAAVAGIRSAIPAPHHGLASVRAWTPGEALPYADHLVDLLVVDADALGARCPADADLLRVVVPQTGALRIRRQGRWATIRPPRPTTHGDWTHYYGNPTGNPVSSDRVGGVPTSIQWISDSPAGKSRETFTLVQGDAHIVNESVDESRARIVARSAFNGFHRWSRENPFDGNRLFNLIGRNGPLAVVDGRVYALEDGHDGPLVAYDAATGEQVLAFAGDLPPLAKASAPRNSRPHAGNLAVGKEHVLLARRDKLTCWDRTSGKRRWVFDGAGRNLAYLAVDPVGGRVGVLMTVSDSIYMNGDRETAFWPTEVLSVGLADGKEVWRVPYPFREGPEKPETGLPGRRVSQFLWAEGAFYLTVNKALGPGGYSIGALDPVTGAPLWLKPDIPEWAGRKADASIGIGTLLVYPHAAVVSRSAVVVFHPRTGASLGEWQIGNSRCDNGAGSQAGWTNFGHFFALGESMSLQADRQEIARNDCGGFAPLANGMVYYQPQVCTCYTALRGFMALSRQDPGAPVPDARRLVRGPAYAATPTRIEGDGDWPTLLGDQRRSAAGSGIAPAALRQRWRRSLAVPPPAGTISTSELAEATFNGPLSAPVVAGGLVLTSEPQAHRIHALDAATGQPAWSVTLGGRIDTPPTVAGGRIYAGGRDGWMTCLDLATGRLAWRFLAARNHRQIAAWGQLESSWPLHGSPVVGGGTVLAVAGRHPDADAGLLAWGLDAVTGAVRWQRTIAGQRQRVELRADAKRIGSDPYFLPNRVENTVASSDGRVSVLPGLRLSLVDGTMSASLGGTRPSTPKGLETDGLLVTDWMHFNNPWLRSGLANLANPGQPWMRSGYRISGGAERSAWSFFDDTAVRRAAWNREVIVAIDRGSHLLFVFDAKESLGTRWRNATDADVGRSLPNAGRLLARIDLADGTVKPVAKNSDNLQDPIALVVAGQTAVIAWQLNGPSGEPSERILQNRRSSYVQVIDLHAKRVVFATHVEPGIIDHGLAVANGAVWMTHDDGSVSSWAN
jgi:outer membrane protein assembly factor BamB